MNSEVVAAVSLRMLYNSLSVQIARVLSRHPRCIAMGPHVDFNTQTQDGGVDVARRAYQRDAIGTWLTTCEREIEEFTLRTVPSCISLPEYVRLRVASDQFIRAWVVTIEIESITTYVAFESVA